MMTNKYEKQLSLIFGSSFEIEILQNYIGDTGKPCTSIRLGIQGDGEYFPNEVARVLTGIEKEDELIKNAYFHACANLWVRVKDDEKLKTKQLQPCSYNEWLHEN